MHGYEFHGNHPHGTPNPDDYTAELRTIDGVRSIVAVDRGTDTEGNPILLLRNENAIHRTSTLTYKGRIYVFRRFDPATASQVFSATPESPASQDVQEGSERTQADPASAPTVV